jgi:hypothetical protein
LGLPGWVRRGLVRISRDLKLAKFDKKMGRRHGGSTRGGVDVVKVPRGVGRRGVGRRDGLFAKFHQLSVDEVSVDEMSVDEVRLHHMYNCLAK